MNPTPPKLIAHHTITQARVGLSTTRPVRAQRWDMGSFILPHDHTYYEICVVNSGHGLHQTDYFQTPAGPGTVVVIPPGKVHAFAEGHRLIGTNIYYLTEWLLTELTQLWQQDSLVSLFLADSLFPRSNHARPYQFDLETRESESVMIDLEDMQREWDVTTPSVLFMQSSFLKVLIRLSRSYARQSPRERGFQFRRPVWEALERIEESLLGSESFSVAALARQLGVSPDHFTRLFKEATSWSPLEYFQMRRVHHACKLLLDPEAKISDIAYRLGYADAAHLSRVFKRFRGTSPREYRRVYTKPDPHTAIS